MGLAALAPSYADVASTEHDMTDPTTEIDERAGERALVAQIRAGDEAAWREFIAAYEGRLAAFARSRLGDAGPADDVVQETFVGFLLSLPNYDEARGLETYLFTICAHKLTDHLRRAGRRPTVPLAVSDSTSGRYAGGEPVGLERSVGSLARSGERRGLESEALAKVLAETLTRWQEKGEHERVACLELLFVRGQANKAAAAALGITEQAVANYKFDFLTRLRDGLRKQNLSPDVFPELA